jgi:hypothetical protein
MTHGRTFFCSLAPLVDGELGPSYFREKGAKRTHSVHRILSHECTDVLQPLRHGRVIVFGV